MKLSFSRGAAVIGKAAASFPPSPGTYRMLDADGKILYVGKAKNLQKRVSSYTSAGRLPVRLQRMVAQTASLEIVVTRGEAEALLLEASLIKSYHPPYNILLRDDKSFPYIAISSAHPFPRIFKHRGAKAKDVKYFGPFPSAGDVNRAMAALQKAFLLRSCPDRVLENRTRPCLQYQIKRCAAPCVGYIPRADYAALTDQALRFLSGKDADVQKQLESEMRAASGSMDYERAASLRDRICALDAVQDAPSTGAAGLDGADVIGVHEEAGKSCVQMFFVRGGKVTGSRAYFPERTESYGPSEIIAAFMSDIYQSLPPATVILTSHAIPDAAVMEEALASLVGKRVSVVCPARGAKRELTLSAASNAKEALRRRLREDTATGEALDRLEKVFELSGPVERIEVYDNSHLFGKHAAGAMIVAGPEGFRKRDYRIYTVDPGGKETGGDDTAMLRQVLARRFRRGGAASAPDLLLIDGGAPQLNAALETLADLGIGGSAVVCIAKGPERNAGREWFHTQGGEPFQLDSRDPLLYYLQRLRDEAHRFAVNAHRAKRKKTMTLSALDAITGIGPVRKRELLRHFGSVDAMRLADLDALLQVRGMTRGAAQMVRRCLHKDSQQ